jgi:hypothetical protein
MCLFFAVTLVRPQVLEMHYRVLNVRMVVMFLSCYVGNSKHMHLVPYAISVWLHGERWTYLSLKQFVFANVIVSCKLCFQTLFVVCFVFSISYSIHHLFVLCDRTRIHLTAFFFAFVSGIKCSKLEV